MSGVKVTIILLVVATIRASSDEVLPMSTLCIMDDVCRLDIENCNTNTICIEQVNEKCDQYSDDCKKRFEACGNDAECKFKDLVFDTVQIESGYAYCMGLLHNAKDAGFKFVEMTNHFLPAECTMKQSLNDISKICGGYRSCLFKEEFPGIRVSKEENDDSDY